MDTTLITVNQYNGKRYMYIFTTCAAIQANLVKNYWKMEIFPKKVPSVLAFATKYGKWQEWIGGSKCTVLPIILAKHEETSIDQNYSERHAELATL